MKIRVWSTVLLLAGSLLAASTRQTVGDDMKDAGKKTTGAVKTGARKTKNGVKKGAHKTASATEKGAKSVKNKTTGTSN